MAQIFQPRHEYGRQTQPDCAGCGTAYGSRCRFVDQPLAVQYQSQRAARSADSVQPRTPFLGTRHRLSVLSCRRREKCVCHTSLPPKPVCRAILKFGRTARFCCLSATAGKQERPFEWNVVNKVPGICLFQSQYPYQSRRQMQQLSRRDSEDAIGFQRQNLLHGVVSELSPQPRKLCWQNRRCVQVL